MFNEKKKKESNASSTIYLSFVIDEELPRPDPPSLDNHVTYESSVRLLISLSLRSIYCSGI